MTIDANQMGADCIEALMEYLKTNNVKGYYSVDVSVINKDNAKNYIKDETSGEVE